MTTARLKIGVFDSGFGGLTVLRALLPLLPHAEFLYLGDTARFPYGERTPEELSRFSAEVTEELRRQALDKRQASKSLQGVALDNQIRKNRTRWLRQALMDAGTKRANELGWPNTYTFTKSLS